MEARARWAEGKPKGRDLTGPNMMPADTDLSRGPRISEGRCSWAGSPLPLENFFGRVQVCPTGLAMQLSWPPPRKSQASSPPWVCLEAIPGPWSRAVSEP